MSENKSYQIWMPLLFSLFTVGGMLIGYNLKTSPTVVNIGHNDNNNQLSGSYGMGRVEEVLRYIESRYVDDVDREELIENAIDNLLEELDPHSSYISSEDLKTVNENLDGNFVGIGIEFDIHKDTILVLSVISGGPSEELGILAGDRIVVIEDSLVAGLGLETSDVTDLLRGDEGTKVRIGVQRVNSDKVIDYEIKRGKIPLKSVDVTLRINDKTGYVKINRFSDSTYEEFMESMDELEGIEDLIIDLRQNPGGYLKEATRILNQLIEERDEMLVYTEGLHSVKKEYKTKGAIKYKLDDIVVIIDEGSASASEIMAGALQDTDRGLIVGRRSFGKGLVQEQYDLSDGGALRLTIARYYTKSGRLIQKSYGDGLDYGEDTNDRYVNGELDSADNITLKDSTEYYTNNDRVVYGGGGIIPDIFVPMNKIYKNDEYLIASSYVIDFVYNLLDKKRSYFMEMDQDEFVKNYQISDDTFNDFVSFCVKKDKELDKENLNAVSTLLKEKIKANIARNIYGLKGYYCLKNQTDPMIIETLKVIDKTKNILEAN